MQRVAVQERPDWQAQAHRLGFKFYVIEGESYWNESAYYRFNLRQIEDDIEAPTEELHAMCLELVDKAVGDDTILRQLRIPEPFWDYIRDSWLNGDKHLYGRMDFAYDGRGPAKFYEYNADTPTSLYESAFFQWVWLEQAIASGLIPEGCDQYNSIQEHLIAAFGELQPAAPLYFACCKGTDEDRGTVQYLEDCAVQAGLETRFIYIDDIGISPEGRFTDLDDYVIPSLFKLYPWEWLMAEEFGPAIPESGTHFLEAPWKAILSNKGILPVLWAMYPNHPSLLPAYFDDNVPAPLSGDWVRKPLLSREGSNIAIVRDGERVASVDGPYDDGGYVWQACQPLPRFAEHYTLVGSWLVADRPVGIGIREDTSLITKDSSRFLPHVILD